MEKQLTFGELIHIFWKKLYLLIIFVIVGAGAGFAWAKINYQPVYTATSSFIVYHKDSKRIENDLKAIPTYESIFANRTSMRLVQKKMKKVSGYHGSVTTLTKKITTASAPNSMVIKVSSDASSAKVAVAMTNNSIKVFKKQVNKIVNAGTVRQLAKANVKDTLKSPSNTKKQFLLGAMVGLAVGILLVIFLERKLIFA